MFDLIEHINDLSTIHLLLLTFSRHLCIPNQMIGQYAPDEAGKNKGFELSGNDPLDKDFNFKEEIHKAIGRHRRYDKPDNMAASEKVDDELEVDDDVDGDDAGGAVDEVMELPMHNKTAAPLSSVMGVRNSKDKGRRKSVNNLPLLMSDLLPNRVTAKKHKVMAKSIVLARQDMVEIENVDVMAMGNDNNNNSNRNSRSRPASTTTATATANNSNETTVAPSMKIWPLNLTRWWLDVGRHLPKSSSSVVVPTTSAHNIDMAVLANHSITNTISDLESMDGVASNATTGDDHRNNAPIGSYDDASTNIKADDDDYKLSSSSLLSSQKKSKLGHLSWYYSPVSVCERCSKVYAELDRLRKLKNKHLVKKQKELLLVEDEKSNRWQEVEVSNSTIF